MLLLEPQTNFLVIPSTPSAPIINLDVIKFPLSSNILFNSLSWIIYFTFDLLILIKLVFWTFSFKRLIIPDLSIEPYCPSSVFTLYEHNKFNSCFRLIDLILITLKFSNKGLAFLISNNCDK